MLITMIKQRQQQQQLSIISILYLLTYLICQSYGQQPSNNDTGLTTSTLTIASDYDYTYLNDSTDSLRGDDDKKNQTTKIIIEAATATTPHNTTKKHQTTSKHHLPTTTEKDKENTDPLIPWIVFIAFIFIPMILIASILLLLLFITLFEDRNRRKKSQSGGGGSGGGGSSTIISTLDYPTKLLPTLPDEHCFPEPHQQISAMIHGEPRPKHYYLDVMTTVKFLQTNQLYHPHSGLLFRLLPNVLYDPLKHCNIRTDISGGMMETPASNQVYSSFTNEVFERYQFMSFDPQRERFYLTEYDTSAIPRLPVEFTPDDYLQIYQHLLNKSSSKKKSRQHPPPVTQPATTTTGGGGIDTISSNPPNDNNLSQKKHPLLLDRRDFTKPQTADYHHTPRSLLPKSGKSNNSGQPPTSVGLIPKFADEEESQYASVMTTKM